MTADITGPIRNGGIGSADYSLARLLADAGHGVTVFDLDTLVPGLERAATPNDATAIDSSIR